MKKLSEKQKKYIIEDLDESISILDNAIEIGLSNRLREYDNKDALIGLIESLEELSEIELRDIHKELVIVLINYQRKLKDFRNTGNFQK